MAASHHTWGHGGRQSWCLLLNSLMMMWWLVLFCVGGLMKDVNQQHCLSVGGDEVSNPSLACPALPCCSQNHTDSAPWSTARWSGATDIQQTNLLYNQLLFIN